MSSFATIVPAAGLGTRMLPLSAAGPKELLPMGDRSLLQWTLQEAESAGVTDVALIGSPNKNFDALLKPQEHIERALVNEQSEASKTLCRLQGSLAVQTCIQDKPLGLGHAVLQAKDVAKHSWSFIQLPDEWYPNADCLPLLAKVISHAKQEKLDIKAVIAVMEVSLEMTRQYGIAAPANAFEGPVPNCFYARKMVEKPVPESAPSRWAIIGRYAVHNDIFPILESTNPGRSGEIQLTDALDVLAAKGQLVCVPFGGVRIDTGSIAQYKQAWQWYNQNV